MRSGKLVYVVHDEKMDMQLIIPLLNPVLTPVGHHKLMFYDV